MGSDYVTAWSVYLASALVLLVCGWRLTRGLWRWLSDLLRVVGAVALLTPTTVGDADQQLAPALFVAAFELVSVSGGGRGSELAVRLLLIAMLAVLVLWLLRLCWFLLYTRRRRAVARQAVAPHAARSGANGPGSRHGA